MTIRQATGDDIPRLMELVGLTVPAMRAAGNLQWDDTYPDSATFLRDVELDQLWVAEAGGCLTGVAAITTEQAPEYARVGWDINEPAIVVHRLLVDPERRGQGIATALMQQAEAVARQRGIAVLRVDTSAENDASQRLFPKLGYTYSGETGFGFRPGLRVLCYEKRLQASHEG